MFKLPSWHPARRLQFEKELREWRAKMAWNAKTKRGSKLLTPEQIKELSQKAVDKDKSKP